MYKEKLETATQLYKQYYQQYNAIAFARLIDLLFAIVIGYKAINESSWLWGFLAAVMIVLFFLLIGKHKQIAVKRRIAKAKIAINEREIAFIEQGIYPADNGKDFEPAQHPYAYDLDILGEKSLYHYLNRTHTYLGRKRLAQRLLYPDTTTILTHQEAIKALTPQLAWRQTFMAHAEQIDDSPSFYDRLQQWAAAPTTPMGKFMRVFTVISPIVFTLSAIIGYIYDYEVLKSIAKLLLTINLSVFFFFIGKMSKEKLGFEHTYAMLYAFKECIAQVETHFPEKNKQASTHIAQLSRLLDDLDSVSNILVSIPLNIFSFYHLHRYRALLQWKRTYGTHIAQWLETVATTEVLCSFANFAYNNPHFVYPTFNNQYRISFEDVGHPLIAENERITNNITLDEAHFIILTGSNMSGKSTFLRTLGVNMLLAQVGLPVCAREASIHPLPLLVSMRLSDSLSDGKSYFFAEINRIEQIMTALKRERCMVLLDEILRGTNSEDKQYGTIKIIERLLSLKAIGIVATHDIEVCKTADRYPEQLQNKCFESYIHEGELSFDYKLREGICQNKNATFLMEKLGIIRSEL
ncbi:DNA mismatch repair protein [Capnocytophaga bilenii]|uniref:MutS-related protein n=1 Tax=Capnocytophaga bilenii TaxID=2819369 RepID=UPI0028D74219|nr:DNA mismatch repair protein [Capnocytophaga bilenii]